MTLNNLKSDKLTALSTEQLYQKCVDDITKIFKSQADIIERQSKMINRLESEHYKDDKIRELQAQIRDLRNEPNTMFHTSPDEWQKIDEWTDKHTKEKHWDSVRNRPASSGTIGGRYSFEFTPTSIGTIGVVKCTCGDEFTFKNL